MKNPSYSYRLVIPKTISLVRYYISISTQAETVSVVQRQNPSPERFVLCAFYSVIAFLFLIL